jgi:hypothetical protein
MHSLTAKAPLTRTYTSRAILNYLRAENDDYGCEVAVERDNAIDSSMWAL